jgi:phenylpropionate dioxygenase-like ring-hydroxylating dioxygenase large terminal subunit
MADIGHGPLQAVPFKVTNPERIPTQRYYDEEFYKLECELLWPHVWQMACRLEEIPEVGDWVEYKILQWSVIVIRTKSGVKAFHNSCRHRGVQIASGHGNCEVQGFQCPFHGWRWNIDGENTFVFKPELFSDEQLDHSELNLVPCRLELWGGCAFINFDDDAAPFIECIRPYAERLDPRNVEQMKIDWWLAAELPTNWKLAMEAFMEGYHNTRTHPQLQAVLIPEFDHYRTESRDGTAARRHTSGLEYADTAIATMKVTGEGMEGMVRPSDIEIAEEIRDKIEFSEDLDEVSMQWFGRLQSEITSRARARNIPMPDLNTLPPASYVEFCFPHYFLLPMFGNAASYRIRPLGPEKCLFELYSLSLYPEGEKRERPAAPIPMRHDDPRWPPIPQQDFSNLPLQQLGLHAKGFDYMRLSGLREGLISNYHRLIDGFLGGVERDKLTAATQVVCSGIDAPIEDIGF